MSIDDTEVNGTQSQYYSDLADEYLLPTLNQIDDTKAWNLEDAGNGVIRLTDDFGLPVSEDEIRDLHAQVKAAARRTTYTTLADDYLYNTLMDLDSSRQWELVAKGSTIVLQDNFGLNVSEDDQDFVDLHALVKARTQARVAIDAIREANKATTIDYTLPESGKIDGVASSGTVVQLTLIHPQEGRGYWQEFEAKLNLRGAGVTEKFDALHDGEIKRIEVAGSEIAAIFVLLATLGSTLATSGRDLERAFVLASSKAEYDAIIASLS
jgi:hypothetical protein